MPSIKDIDVFKSRVYQLGGEPDERRSQGLPPLDIKPPPAQLEEDVARLLGEMPLAPPSPSEESAPLEEGPPDLLGDFFASASSRTEEPQRRPEDFTLDELIAGMGGEDLEAVGSLGPEPISTAGEFEGGMDDLGAGIGGPEVASDLGLPDLTPEPATAREPVGESLEELLASAPQGAGEETEEIPLASVEEVGPAEVSPEVAPAEAEESATNLLDQDLTELLAKDISEVAELSEELPTGEGGEALGAEELGELSVEQDLAGVDHTGSEIWDAGEGLLSDFFLKGDLAEEMRGLAETTEKDVEAFDESKEAEEFSLDEFGFYGAEEDFVGGEAVLEPQAVFQVPETIERPISLTPAEFERLKKNLDLYPLNLKIAIEEALVEKDLSTADANKLVRNLVSGVSAKAMAKMVGDLIGRRIEIPRGYAKGLGEEFEARQASLIYQAQRIILPILMRFTALSAAVGLVLAAVGFLIYRPARAHWLYSRGLEELRQGRAAEAEKLFLEAVGTNDVPSWYITYAEEYLEQENLEGARIKFLQLLRAAYPQDRAGLLLQPQRPERVIQDLERIGYGGVDVLGLGLRPPVVTEVRPMRFLRPHREGLIRWALAEMEQGFDGKSADKHFKLAEALLFRAKDLDASNPQTLIAQGDLYRAWARSLGNATRQSLIRFDLRTRAELRQEANRSYTEYTSRWDQDALITYRWVEYFMEEELTPENTPTVFREMARLRSSIQEKPQLRPTGRVLASWAGWHLDREVERLSRLGQVQDWEARLRSAVGHSPGRAAALLEEELPLREATGLEEFKIYFHYRANYQRALTDNNYRPQIYVQYRTPSGQVREPLGPRENPARMEIIPGGGGWYVADLTKVGIPPGQPVLVTFLFEGKSLTGNKEFLRDRTGWLYMDGVYPMWFPQEPSIEGRPLMVNRSPPPPEVSQQDLQMFRDWLLAAQNGPDAAVPEIHFQLARYFRVSGQSTEERKALSAADYYFRILSPREQRRSERLADRIETLVRIGELQRQDGQTAQAERTFQEARGLFESAQRLGLWEGQPVQARLYGYLGDLYFFHGGDWAQALAYYDRALSLGAITPPQRYRRAVALYQRGRYTEALEQFFILERSRQYRKNPNVRYALAATFFRLQNYVTAAELYGELYQELKAVVERIADWQPQERERDRELAENYYRVMNNLAAARFFAETGGDRGHPAFGDILALITEAKTVEDALARRFGPDPEELVRSPEIGLVGMNMQELLGGGADPLIFPSLPLSPDSKTF